MFPTNTGYPSLLHRRVALFRVHPRYASYLVRATERLWNQYAVRVLPIAVNHRKHPEVPRVLASCPTRQPRSERILSRGRF